MLRVDEDVSVVVGAGGEPIGFSWRGVNYLIESKPMRWFARRQWWVEAARVQRGIGAGVLEVEMWRVLAVGVNSPRPAAQFELLHSFVGPSRWQLVRIFN